MSGVNGGHRYRALDTYRFLAASGVVFYHFENHFAPFLVAPTHVFGRLQLCVDFFFVLSGFVIMHCYGDRIVTAAAYGAFLRKRLARIYPLHLATMLVFLLIGAAITTLQVPVRDKSFFDMSLVPANLLLVQAWGVTDHAGLNIPAWSISAEWFLYLLFPVLALIVARAGGARTLCLAAGLALAIESARQAAGLGTGVFATIDFGNFRALPSFVAGMAIQVLVSQAPALRVKWWMAHGLALLVLALMLANAPPELILTLFAPLVALIALAERAEPRTVFASRFGGLLGDASFAIYMTHTLFQVAAVIVARGLGWTSLPALIAISLVTYLAIVLAGVASFRWFEDPLRRRLSSRRVVATGLQASRSG